MKRRDPHQWAKERLKDPFFVQAKNEGYRARSAYKLIEIQEKLKIIGKNANVLDLGAAPGAWLQVARKLTHGTLEGIDLLEIEPINNVCTLKADVFAQSTTDFLTGKSFNVILSDIAPNSCGQPELDHLVLINILDKVLEFSEKHLQPGGNMCLKVFEGSEFISFRKRFNALFAEAKLFKPKASKADSREVYLIGMGYRL